ncbi:unnamed protein product [Adineta steineri]|uniref:Neurabin-1-like protein n=1 Tax=Adineta steineri TaxID=433720 RepID=A0A815AUR3_9BILA|nr:unnamed protein product [Adineta steineri]
MANILIHSAIPSPLTNTDSASNFIVDTPTETSHTDNNKYNGHVTRLRNIFTEHSLMANKLNSDDYPLLTNIHPTNYHETKENFQTLNDPSICNNAPLMTTKAMANKHQDHNHNTSAQSMSSTLSNRSYDVVSNPTNEDAPPYAIINRRYSNAEQHYDYPSDTILKLKKHQRDENDPKNEQITTRFLPFNVLKRMDHLNTVFVKPTKIEQSLPKLIFQDNNNNNNNNNNTKQEQLKTVENPIFHEAVCAHVDDRSSTPLFYEKPGLPETSDDTLSNDTRRVKFSNAPIRVYPTYSPSEYDRRNEDINPFAAAAEYELEKRIEKMNIFTVEVEKGPDGLGISVLGMGVGADSGLEKLGIFVKSLNPQGIIAKDGRIQVGDQIIEVNGQSLVGVTHACATNVLKTTSGVVKFIIGREKEPEKSEIFALIQRSLQLDQQHEDISDTFQQYHDAYYEQNFHDVEDEEEPTDEKMSNEFEIEILKQCYESLERTLDNTEKEKQQYQQLYLQAQKDLKQIEEKYFQATILIKDLQDRDTKLRQQQIEISERQDKHIKELMKKIEELEKVIATTVKSENSLSSLKTTEMTASYPSDVSDRTAFRSRTSSGQNPMTLSSTRIPSLSLEKILTRSQQDLEPISIRTTTITNNKSSDQLDRSSPIHKRPLIKACTINVPSMHVSTPSLGEISNDSYMIDNKFGTTRDLTMEKTRTQGFSSDEYIEIKDWTTDQCIQWLTIEKLTSFIPTFLNRNIDGEKLLVLDGSKMKAMGIKSSKDRDQLKTKIKELKSLELNRLRERLLTQPSLSQRSGRSEKKSRSSSLTKIKERRFFSSSFGK